MTWKSHYPQNLLSIFVHRAFHGVLAGASWVLWKWPEKSHSNCTSHWGSSNWLEWFKSRSKCELSKWLPRVKTFYEKLFSVISLKGYQVGMATFAHSHPIPGQWRGKVKNKKCVLYRCKSDPGQIEFGVQLQITEPVLSSPCQGSGVMRHSPDSLRHSQQKATNRDAA